MSAAPTGPVVLVGSGKMGGALLRGWLADGWARRLAVIDPGASAEVRGLAAEHGFTVTDTPGGHPPPAALVLAIKPQMLDTVAPSLLPLCRPDTLVISVMAGKTVADIAARLPAGAIVRAMPNTPAAVRQGITGLFASQKTDEGQRALASALLGCVGEVEWLPREELIDAVTAVSGSGPAYVFLLTECLAAAACAVGLDKAQASRFARATVAGAGALMAAQADTAPDQLRRDVTSPGGTTAAALEVLMRENGLEPLMREAVVAARDRARALAG